MMSALKLLILQCSVVMVYQCQFSIVDASSDGSVGVFSVRNRRDDTPGRTEHRRDLFDLQISFSKDGDPIDLPEFQLQVFPTPQILDSNSATIFETALQDYLTSAFEESYRTSRTQDNSITTTDPEFTSLEVQVLNMRAISTSNRRQQRTLLSQPNTRRQHQQQQQQEQQQQLVKHVNEKERLLQGRQGTELDVKTIMRFRDGNFPSMDDIQINLRRALFDNFNVFLADYLPFYNQQSPELQGLDSGNFVSSFTPTSPPAAVDNPTMSPTMSTTNDRGTGGSISQINQGTQMSKSDDNNRINALYPAIGAGVAMFVLTALIFFYRGRRKIDDVSTGSVQSSDHLEHISIDYDGREEAMQMEMERQQQRQQQQQQQQQQEQWQVDEEQEYANREIARRLRESRNMNRYRNGRRKQDPEAGNYNEVSGYNLPSMVDNDSFDNYDDNWGDEDLRLNHLQSSSRMRNNNRADV